ncbi:MAG: hypothetical protein MJ097_05770 [Dorea sp.]|nr:hypothetical protein [Dorea sp.]
MKNKITRKDFFMEIKKSPGRFISIFFIVAMGVAFFSGIRSSEPDMRLTGDYYFDQTHLMDIKCVSTMGLTDDDIDAISKVKGVEYVEGSWSMDFLELRDDQEKVVHVMSLNDQLNLPDVTEGRLPEKVGECLVDDEEGYEIGDKIVLKTDGEDDVAENLKVEEFTIVGTGSSPCYISFNRGNSTIGNGSVAAFVLVPAETFDMDVYTEAYIQVEDALAQTTYTDAYQNLVDYVMDEIEKITAERSRIRRQEIVDDANEELEKGRQELADAKKEADDKLADGKKELEDAAAKLADGQKELVDGKKELDSAANELASGKKELANAKKEIDAGKKELAQGKKELADAKQQLDDGKKQLSDAKKEVAAGKKELNKGKDQLNESQKQVDAGRQEVTSGKQQLEDGKAAYDAAYADFLKQKEAAEKEMEDGKKQLSQAQQIFDTAWNVYNQFVERLENLKAEEPDPQDPSHAQWQIRVGILEQGLPGAKRVLDYAQSEFDKQKADAEAKMEEGKAQLEAAEAEFERQKAIIEANEKQLEAAENELNEGQKQIDDGWKEIEANEEKLNQAEELITSNEKDLAEGTKQYQQGKKEYDKGLQKFKKGEQKYHDGVAQMAAGEQAYQQGLASWEQGKKEYEDGLKEYEDGVEAYEKGKKEADEKIADAEAELADAEQKIADIDMPQWYVYDRGTLPEHSGYGFPTDILPGSSPHQLNQYDPYGRRTAYQYRYHEGPWLQP